MTITINRTGEHSLDVVEAEIFSKMKKKNASLCIGTAHGEMLIEFLTIKYNLSGHSSKKINK